MTVPVIIVLALILGDSGGGDGSPSAATSGPLPALTPSAPAPNPAVVEPCDKLLRVLPIHLGKLAPRAVHSKPDSRFVVAWGDPAIILRCGVARPAALHPGSSEQFISGSSAGTIGPFYAVTSSDGNENYTTVDRAAYVEVTIPAHYQGSTYLPILSSAITKAMPAVCYGGQPGAGQLPPQQQLCTRRK